MSERRHLILALVTDVCDEDVTYPSCMQCCSKLFLDELSSGQRYRCLKCGSHCSLQHVQYRYRLVLAVSDGQITGRVVVFGRTLEGFFGKTATDFHRSVFELGKSGYPAESMLWDALMRTFHGKYFYFGMKTTTNPAANDPPTLSDVLNKQDLTDINTQPSQNLRDNSHTLVYQMIQCNEGAYATVTDHMRFTVNALRRVRKGEALTQSVSASPFLTLCRAESIKTNTESNTKLRPNDSCQKSVSLTDSHFECSSLCKTSSLYSKQLSVMFSFENDSHASDSATTASSVVSSTEKDARQRGYHSVNDDIHFQSSVSRMYSDVTSQHNNDFARTCDNVESSQGDVSKIHFDVVNGLHDVESRHKVVTSLYCDMERRHSDVASQHSDVARKHSDAIRGHSEVSIRQNDVTSKHSDVATQCTDHASTQIDVANRHNYEASGCSIEGFVSFASQDEHQDLCLSTMDTFPVTQKLNFTEVNDMHGSFSNNSYIVINDDLLDIPYVHNQAESSLNDSCDGSGQCDPSQGNGVATVAKLFKASSNSNPNQDSVANIYLPDSEDLSAFLDTFEEAEDMTGYQTETTKCSGSLKQSHGTSAGIILPIHDHTERTKYNEDNGNRDCNTDKMVVIKSKCSENEVLENKRVTNSSISDKADSCNSESVTPCLSTRLCLTPTGVRHNFAQSHQTEDKANAVVTKDPCLSDTEDLEAFLNSFGETISDDEQANIIQVKTGNGGPESHLNVSDETEAHMPLIHPKHLNDPDKVIQSQNSCEINRIRLQRLPIDKEELQSISDAREDTIHRTANTFSQLNTKSECHVSNTEDDSGFSQPEDVQECNIGNTIVGVSKYVDNTSHISKTESNDLELFFAEISLNKDYERKRDIDLSTEKDLVVTDLKGILNLNKQTSRRNCSVSLASQTSSPEYISNTSCTIETELMNQPAEKHSHLDSGSAEQLDEETCKASETESQKYSLYKKRDTDPASSLLDDNFNSQIAGSVQNAVKADDNVNKALSSQLDFSVDLFEDSSDMYMNNDVFNNMVNESSQDLEEVSETADKNKENSSVESEVVITESQDVQDSLEQDLPDDPQPKGAMTTETDSPASTKRVQFDRRLQRVTSCQLIDVQMRQRGSPSDRLCRKSLLKPCLKIANYKAAECEKLSVKTPDPGVLTESCSHSASSSDHFSDVPKNIHKRLIYDGNARTFSQTKQPAECSFTDGSQDLFGPSPVPDNDTCLANTCSVSHRSNSSHVETETDTPDLFISMDCVIEKFNQHSNDAFMTPDIFTQDTWFDNSPTTSALLSDVKTNNDTRSSSLNRHTDYTGKGKDTATLKTNKKYKYLIEDTPIFDKSEAVAKRICTESVNVSKKAASSSRSNCRPVLCEVKNNCQDTPDLFDSPDSSYCGDFDQAFMQLPDQSGNLAKQLFF